MAGPSLHRMAHSLLRMAEDALDAVGAPPPPRRVVYFGQIPADCEQLAVVFGGWTPTPPLEGMTVCGNYRWAADFTVLVTRKTPALPTTKGPPPVAAMDDASVIASTDADAMLDLVAAIGEHDAAVSVRTDPPQGGLQSTVLEVSLPLTEVLP